MNFLYVFIGGGIGSICRYSVGLITERYVSMVFPLSTFVSNLISCVILGFLIAMFMVKTDLDHGLKLFLVVGFCGGFSTYSAFTWEIFSLLKSGNLPVLLAYLFASLLICLVGFYAGYHLYKLSHAV